MSKRQNASALTSHIGYHLRVASNAVSHAFARKLDECGVTVAEWVILREMYSQEKSTSPSAVAEITALSRGAISKLIDRLLKKNLVSRSEFSADRRYQEVQLTTLALKMVPKLARIADENDESFFSVLNKSERQALTKILIKIAESHKLNTRAIE